jgi:putative polymerase
MPLSATDAWRNRIAALLLLFAVGYNFVLAIVNAQLFSIGPSAAYAAELVAYAGCFVLGVGTLDRNGMALMLAGIGGVVLINLARTLALWEVDPKFLRDALVPFAFLMLGTAYRGSLPKLALWLALIVVLVAALEITFPTLYGDLVDPRSYFINTRGASEEDFWNPDSNLNVNATRPGERIWLAGMTLPRASSIFVEPVTMGNFIIFFAAVALTFRRAMGVGGQVLSLLAVLFLLIASDGRLATATCLMMLALVPLFRRLDQSLSWLVFAGVIAGGWLLVLLAGVDAYEDTMLGRIFVTVDALSNMSPRAWLGLDLGAPYTYSDSGIAYFIASQSLATVLAFLVGYAFLLRMPTAHGQLLKNLFIFAFALSLLVSNSYFSIKTGALWWFACGYLWQVQAARVAAARRWVEDRSVDDNAPRALARA